MDSKKLNKIITNMLAVIIIGSVIFIGITTLIMRFSHPEFTETQLMINHFKQYWYGYVVFVILWFIRLWNKVSIKR